MRRFLKGIGITALPLVLIGGLVTVVGGPDGEVGVEARPVAQTEDAPEGADGEAPGDSEPAVSSSLAGVQALLSRLSPQGADAETAAAVPSQQRIFLSRDPFDPVVPEEDTGADGDGGLTTIDPGADGTDGSGTDGDGADGDGDGTDGDGTDDSGTDGDGTDDSGADGDGTDGSGTDGDGTDDDGASSEDVCTGDEDERVCGDDRRVVTVDGFTDGGDALITVDGVTYTVGVDEEFAENFRVEAINPPCVTYLFGDESYSQCEGVTTLK